MRRVLFIIALTLLASALYAQNAGESHATLSAGKMEILYTGITNTVYLHAHNQEEIKVSFSGCEIKNVEGNKYEVFVPDSLINSSYYALITELDGKLINAPRFFIHRVPDPKAWLSVSYRNKEVPKSKILDFPMITASMSEDFQYDLAWKVDSYRVFSISNGKIRASVECQGATLPETVQHQIRDAQIGTVLFFEDIHVTSSAGSRTIEGFYIIIK